ncbi:MULTISPECIES: alpha/beta fold hydrolase [Micromonospora]|uniref:Alpha/beta fold hydrolase n=1 Tax=Micromonospora solifontis TaxID=2487138 RepID=A0ABX9WJ24_9ACTN|nr:MULTISPECIES: alpha/beta hydrolase [Micromonospora]NES15665.1 alpha/beta fold hydrolase [Micromonospora sp. PPF5-17B]NES35965.1 alpha/beta fold hydrolase [Micromonospora solifontis]NES56962.1 alpha/beta fold hydrolase [Micromonospora sp. PPF5-6]RNM00128.1 alpha/beta fold hydrolase [Micromonospora solifontis]
MVKIEVNGTQLAYDEAGSGSPVVLLHAGIADRRMWRGQLPALAARHRVIAPDLRGYGDSELPPAPFAHHDDVIGLLDALGIAQAALVGCSFGGRVAVDTALAYPERVSALALLGAPVSGHEWTEETERLWNELVGDVDPEDFAATAQGEVRFWVVGPTREPADVDPELIRFAVELDRRALAAEQALSAVEVGELDPPAVDRLGELRMPVLAGTGADDVADLRRLADRIAAEAPRGVRLPDVPDAAHLLPLERPEPVNAALLDFLP